MFLPVLLDQMLLLKSKISWNNKYRVVCRAKEQLFEVLRSIHRHIETTIERKTH